MTALRFVLTDAGRAAMVDPGGGTAAVTVAQAGVTASVVVAAPTLEVLPGEIKRLDAVAGLAVDADTVHLTVRDSSTDAYDVRALALYLGDGTLFAVYAQPDPICQKADVTAFLLAADLKFIDGNADLVQFGDTNFLNPPATETTQGVAYLATVAEALAGAVADKIISPATMAAVLANYIEADRLGQPNGVATLGADGKLAVSQRPPIDLIDVWPVASQAAMLALAATVGDFAVRADNGLVYVLQALPATTLANWLEISTPAPVSSVNGKTGAVVLTAADVGAVPTARSITGGGLVTGGGNLTADRVLTVLEATPAEALAGALHDRALSPASLGLILAQLASSVPAARTLSGTGLITGGGNLAGDRAFDVAIASAAEIAAGVANNKAVTPAGLAGLPQSLTPNGYFMWPGGFMVQWIQYRAPYSTEASVYLSLPIAFQSIALPAAATGWISGPNTFRDLFPQIAGAVSLGGLTVQLQAATSNDKRIDGFDILVFGK
jgi:hypothetical protein